MRRLNQVQKTWNFHIFPQFLFSTSEWYDLEQRLIAEIKCHHLHNFLLLFFGTMTCKYRNSSAYFIDFIAPFRRSNCFNIRITMNCNSVNEKNLQNLDGIKPSPDFFLQSFRFLVVASDLSSKTFRFILRLSA